MFSSFLVKNNHTQNHCKLISIYYQICINLVKQKKRWSNQPTNIITTITTTIITTTSSHEQPKAKKKSKNEKKRVFLLIAHFLSIYSTSFFFFLFFYTTYSFIRWYNQDIKTSQAKLFLACSFGVSYKSTVET